MDKTDAIRSHSFSELVPRQFRQDGNTLILIRCQKCRRDFVRRMDADPRWRAAYSGNLNVELLADSVNRRWTTEPCPLRFLPSDDDDGAMRQSETSRHAD